MQKSRSARSGSPGSAGPQLSRQDVEAVMALYSRGRLEEAEKKARKLIRQHPRALVLFNVLGAAQAAQGKFRAAAATHRRVLEQAPDYPEGHYNLGVALQALQEFEDAADAYKRALSLKPALLEARNNLGVVLQAAGRFEEAVSCYRKVLQARPDYATAHNNLGNSLKALGQLEDAQASYRQALRLDPRSAEAHNNLGSALHETGRAEEAHACHLKALELNPGYADAHYGLAMTLADMGRLDEAVASYRKAIELKPGHTGAYNNLGNLLREAGKADEAVSCFERALELDPEFAEAHNNLGIAFNERGQAAEAETSYRKALEHRPDYAEAHHNLCDLYEKTNRIDAAKAAIKDALRFIHEDAGIRLVQARLRRREGDVPGAIETLEPLVSRPLPARMLAQAHNELGKLFDREGDCGKAFEHFARANEISADAPAASRFRKERFLANIEKIGAAVTADRAASWKEPASAPDGGMPAFIVGFPRSGTTLLDQILDSHPRIQVMEEKPVVDEVIERLPGGKKEFPASLSGLSAGDVTRLRMHYFQAADSYIARSGSALLVDKLPLNIRQIPLIVRLFPDAPVLLAMRHPCDVVLSNFMQNYRLNEAMANFFTLADAAHCYARVMDLWLKFIELLPVNYHTVRYESLVSDFDGEVRAALDFLRLGWDDSVLGYSEHARSRPAINTPSYQAVTEPINARARYRWKRYRGQLEPVLPVLTPFIDAFGYSD